MFRKTFVCLYRRIICRMYTIFNTAHAMPNMSNIYQFKTSKEYLRELECAITDRQADKPNA